MLFQFFFNFFLLVIPPQNIVLGMAHIETIQMNLSDEPLVDQIVGTLKLPVEVEGRQASGHPSRRDRPVKLRIRHPRGCLC